MDVQEAKELAEDLHDLEPLTEVVAGVSFVCPSFSTIDYGLFYEQIRHAFPRVSTQPPIATTNETGQPVYVPSLPRIWFESEDQHELVQLQENKLVYNWKKFDGKGTYPHFAAVFAKFRDLLSQFSSMLERDQRGPLFEQQYEFSYINNIKSEFKALVDGPVFKWESRDWNKTLRAPLYQVVQYVFKYDEDAITLRVTARPAIEVSTQREVTSFQIDAKSIGAAELDPWFEAAHSLTRKAFEDLLTESALTIWRQTS
jgi:uncharacterized protein (TIGR04255 family)